MDEITYSIPIGADEYSNASPGVVGMDIGPYILHLNHYWTSHTSSKLVQMNIGPQMHHLDEH